MSTKNSKNTNIILAFVSLLIVVVVVALAGFFLLKDAPEFIQGQAEITEYRVSSKVPSRILKFYVSEGDSVQVGDTLVVLEAPDVMAKLTQADAMETAAKAQDEKVLKGARVQQIQAAYEMWQKAKAGVDIAEKSYKRVKTLFEQGVMTAQKMDEVTAQRDAAVATEKAAKSQYELVREGAEKEDKVAAAAMVSRAKGGVAEVESYVKETVLTAQLPGQIMEVYPQIGELVGSGAPIMSVGVVNDLWVTFQVREDLLEDLAVGAECTAFIPALNKKEVRLKVNYMKDMGSFATWKATKTTGQYDLRTFEVKAVPLQPVKGLCAGMSVILERKNLKK